MVLVDEDYKKTLNNITRECRSKNKDLISSPYVTMQNVHFLMYTDQKRMNEILRNIECNYNDYHKDDDMPKVHYFLKAAELTRKYEYLTNNLSEVCFALLVTEMPFDVYGEANYDRFKLLANDELLTEVKVLSNRYLPSDFICTILSHFDKKNSKRKIKSLNDFRYDEIDAVIYNKYNFFKNLVTKDEYKKKLEEEGELSKNGAKRL